MRVAAVTSVATLPHMAKATPKLEQWQLEDAARLKELFKEKSRLNQTEFGARYEIGNQGYVWQLMNGRRPLNIDTARKFADGLGCSIDEISPTLAGRVAEASSHLSNASDETEFVPIRRLDVRLSAGHGRLITSEDELSRLSFRADFLRSVGASPDHTVSVSVQGDSMEPLIPDGATILVNRGSTSIVNGKVYAFRRHGDLLVKRLYKGNGGFIARSENPAGGYEDLHLNEEDPEIEIIGRAFWVGFKL